MLKRLCVTAKNHTGKYYFFCHWSCLRRLAGKTEHKAQQVQLAQQGQLAQQEQLAQQVPRMLFILIGLHLRPGP